jgi:general secretion pathway protein N
MILAVQKRRFLYCAVALLNLWPVGISPVHAGTVRLEELEQTRTRPLFSPSRRPPPEAPAPVAETAAAPPPVIELPPPSLVLVGVVMSTNQKAILVRRIQDTKSVRLVIDDNIDGWKVTSIGLEGVTFKQEERLFSLAFPKPNGVRLQ